MGPRLDLGIGEHMHRIESGRYIRFGCSLRCAGWTESGGWICQRGMKSSGRRGACAGWYNVPPGQKLSVGD